MTAHWHCKTQLFSTRMFCVRAQQGLQRTSPADSHTVPVHTCTHTHKWLIRLPLPLLFFPFPSLSLWHPSLSVAMDYETNFYHYTLQVKKGSWECAIYAGFDFYVASTGSSIIAPRGTLVHRAPDEMLSWHRYQSPYICPSPVPGDWEGACAAAAGVPSLAISPFLPPWWWRQQPQSSVNQKVKF